MTAIQDIVENTDNLPEDIKKKLLLKLANNKYATSDALAEVITGNYDRLPANVRNELLLKLADNEDAVGALAWAAANDFDKLPEKIQNLSFKLADDEDLSWTLAKSIIDNYEKLPENRRTTLLFKLASHDYAAASLAREMTGNYDRLPANVRNELLLKLADNKYAVNEVKDLITQNYDKLEQNIRGEILQKVDFPPAHKMKKSSLAGTKRLPYKICEVCGEKTIPPEKRDGRKWGYRSVQKCDNCFFVENKLFKEIKIRKRKLPKKVKEAETVFMILDRTTNELVGKFDSPEDLRKKLELYRAKNPNSKIWVISMKYRDFTDIFISDKSPLVKADLIEEINAFSK